MARMSIDDSVLRDPRVKGLAASYGWPRHQAIGALLDVWAVCYDRVSPILTAAEVDLAVEISGFCDRMVAAGLAKPMRGSAGEVRISGVEDRIGYLESNRERARQGGVKSGETRRSKKEATLRFDSKRLAESDEAVANPSALASPSALPPAQDEEPRSARPRSIKVPMPADWTPNAGHAELAAKLGVDMPSQVIRFADYAKQNARKYADWDAAFRTWLRNAAEFSQRRHGTPAGGVIPIRPMNILNRKPGA